MVFLLVLIARLTWSTIRTAVGVLSFAIAVSLAPALLLGLYAFEPHRPAPAILEGLPPDDDAATLLIQSRLEKLVANRGDIAQFEDYLTRLGFEVDARAKIARFTRRHLDCIESYMIFWRETPDSVRWVASAVRRHCPGLFKT